MNLWIALCTLLLSCSMSHSSAHTTPSAMDFDKLWKEVESYEEKGQLRSALELVEQIYAEAQRIENQPHWTRAYIVRSEISRQLQEEGQARELVRFETDIEEFPQPMRAVLHSHAARYYHQYLNNNRWRISNRTTLADDSSADPAEWSVSQIENRIRHHFKASTEVSLDKVTEEPGDWSMLVREDEISADWRLIDLIYRNAIEYFSNNRNVTSSIHRFTMDRLEYIAPLDNFLKLKINSDDVSDNRYLTLLYYQQWLDGLSARPAERALVDARRLIWAYGEIDAEDKLPRYHTVLEQSIRESEYPCAYRLALSYLYVEQARLYPIDPKGPYTAEGYPLALEIVSDCAKSCTDERIKNMCTQLRAEIQATSIGAQIDQFQHPDQRAAVHLTYRNIDRVYLWMYKVLPEDLEGDFYGGSDGREFIIPSTARLVQEHVISLDKDEQMHLRSSDFSLDPVGLGQYVLFVSEYNSIKKAAKQHSIQSLPMQYTRLTVASVRSPQKYPIVVADRYTGSPIDKAVIEVYSQDWGRNKRRFNKLFSRTTNSQGEAKLSIDNKARANHFRISHGDDLLVFSDYIGAYRELPSSERGYINWLTDRSIYRPGQTIHFEGIFYSERRDSDLYTLHDPTLKTGAPLTVQIYDANRKEIYSQRFTTDDYGAFSGSFVLPSQGLTGVFSIGAEGLGNAYNFRVEEYKRPRFEIEIDTLDGDYVIGQQIDIEGIAKNYSGAVLPDAKIKYRVTRSMYMPYWRYDVPWNYCFPGRESSIEVAYGEVLSDASGRWKFSFDASRDPQISSKYNPQYEYAIEIIAVDPSGETQSYTESITVGDRALNIEIRGEDIRVARPGEKLHLRAHTLMNYPRAVDGRIVVERLQSPSRVTRDLPWQAPSRPLYERAEWVRLHPDLEWMDENDPSSWKVAQKILDEPITIEKKSAGISMSDWTAGVYKISVSAQDAYAKPIETIRYITVLSDRAPESVPVHAELSKKTAQPGDRLSIDLWTAIEQPIYITIERPGRPAEGFWKSVDGAYSHPIEILDSDYGGLVVQVFSFHKGEKSQKIFSLEVPRNYKNLKVEWIGVRDRLEPGSPERWEIKITDTTGAPVDAQLAAALYDASLDFINPHRWNTINYPHYPQQVSYRFPAYGMSGYQPGYPHIYPRGIPIDNSDWLYGYGGVQFMGRMSGVMKRSRGVFNETADVAAMEVADMAANDAAPPRSKEGAPNSPSEEGSAAAPPTIRKNLQETVFFYPRLKTDASGTARLEFTMGEALTRWKLLLYGHTPDLKQGLNEYLLETQKDVMILPLPPRYLREGDEMVLTARVTNTSDKTQTVRCSIDLDRVTQDEDVTGLFGLQPDAQENISLEPGESKIIRFPIDVPSIEELAHVKIRYIAQAGSVGDAEEHILPILTNRTLITESLPLSLRDNKRSWNLDRLREVAQLSSTDMRSIKLEISSHPVWYAVQALPYIEDSGDLSTSSLIYRYYTHSIALHLMNQYPILRQTIEQWQRSAEDGGPDAFMSALRKNPELRSVVLEHTPWLLTAESEEEQKRRIVLFFDLNNIAHQQAQSWNKIMERLQSDGGLSWAPSGRSSLWITQEFMEYMGRLKSIGALDPEQGNERRLVQIALYVEAEHERAYHRLKKYNSDLDKDHLGALAIHYLYIRSLWPEYFNNRGPGVKYYQEQAVRYWTAKGLYMQGLIASYWQQADIEKSELTEILRSIKERAIIHPETGRYWKQARGYHWYQSPLIAHTHMIGLFDQAGDADLVADLKLWLLAHKQTNSWPTSRATAAAVQALVSSGAQWTEASDVVRARWSDSAVELRADVEAGTGYYQVDRSVDRELPRTITLEKSSIDPAYGAVYWQYWTDLDAVDPYEDTPLSLQRTLTLKRNTDQGPELLPITQDTEIRPGDVVTVRLVLKVDRPMSYLHMRDERAAGLEPLQQLSRYRWQDGLGYYESVRDASVDWYIDQAQPGTYVFQYDLAATYAGNFSAGLTRIQSYYAPEFGGHSEGVRMQILP